MIDDEDEADAGARPRRPLWVRAALSGLPSRSSAWGMFGLSMLLACASLIAGFFYPPAYYGTLFMAAALWYYYAIRWVDRNDRWDA